jgi:O-antigen ligase
LGFGSNSITEKPTILKNKIIPMPLYQKLLLILIFFIPFSFALSPTKGVDLNILKILIPLLFLLWLAHSLITKKVLLDNRPRFWLLITFFLLVFLSFFWTIAPTNALRKILFFLTTLPLYFTFYQAQQSPVFIKKFFSVLSFSVFLSSLLALIPFALQFIIGLNPVLNFLRQFIAPFFLGHSLANLVNQYSSWLVNISGQTILRTFGAFPDPHLFSLYLSFSLPLIFYFYLITKQKKYFLYIFTILMAILFSFSRAAYLSLLAGGFFLFLTSRPGQLIKQKIFSFYLLFNLILFLLIIPNPIFSRFTSSFNLQEGSNSGRMEMWLTALQIINQHPLLGIGLGGLAEYIDSSFGIRNPIYAHNLFLDFGAETGIFAMLILFLLILSPLILFLKNFIQTKQIPFLQSKNIQENLLLQKILATAFLIFFIHSLFETPFFSIRVFPLFLMFLSLKTTVTD